MNDHDEPPEGGRTVFLPGAPGADPEPSGELPGQPEAGQPGARERRAARGDSRGRTRILKPGVELNGIYRVTRFIAEGGMGEVYEGVNVNNTTERVAIKVMRPELAHDDRAQALFLREGDTLVHLAHPALVRYRLATREPTLGLPYLVTEYVEGEQLSHVMGGQRPAVADVVALMRRLAEGLAAAHEEQIFHRDLSPDNIMLPKGRLAAAKIIDFGIAKKGLTSEGTILADTVAGKFAYMAPEQLGDFSGEIGAWTDVYGLALVAIAFATGWPPDTGSNAAEALDRRRAGIDVSKTPPQLQPLLRRMLLADPARRISSMAGVIKGLDEVAANLERPRPQVLNILSNAVAEGRRHTVGGARALVQWGSRLLSAAPLQSLPKPAIYGGAAALGLVVVAIVGVVVVVSTSGGGAKKADGPALPPPPPPVDGEASKAVATAVAAIPCSWLDVTSTTAGSDGSIAIAVRGASSESREAILQRVADAAQPAAGGARVDVSADDYRQVQPDACPLLDAMRARRDVQPDQATALAANREFEKDTTYDCPRGSWARPIVTVDARDLQNFSLLVMDDTGRIEQVTENGGDRGGRRWNTYSRADPGEGTKHTLSVCRRDMRSYAAILLKGRTDATFNLGLTTGVMTPAKPVLVERLAAQAEAQGWTFQMLWFNVIDNQPDQPEPPEPEKPQAPPPPPPPPPPVVPQQLQSQTAPQAQQTDLTVVDEGKGKPEACMRAGTPIGEFTRDTCVIQIFKGHCDVREGSWGSRKYQRVGGDISETKKGMGPSRLKRLSATVAQSCP